MSAVDKRQGGGGVPNIGNWGGCVFSESFSGCVSLPLSASGKGWRLENATEGSGSFVESTMQCATIIVMLSCMPQNFDKTQQICFFFLQIHINIYSKKYFLGQR